MHGWKHQYLVVISFILTIIWSITILLRQNAQILTIQGYSEASISALLFSFAGLFGYVFLMLNVPKMYKILSSLVAIISLMFLFFIIGLGAEGKDIIHQEDHTIIVSKYSFLFAGDYTFYERKNWFVSEYLATCSAGEDIACTYHIADDQLFVTECGHHSNVCETYTYDLKE